MYHTNRCIRNVDHIADENTNSKQSEIEGTLLHKQLEKAHSFVHIVEQGGENVEECAREAIALFENLLAEQVLSR